MTVVAAPRKPGVAARRTGYGISVAVNALVLYLANVRPGWQALPFLTPDTRLVMGLVNASLLVSLGANLVYLVHDPRWLKALGDVATTTVGLLAMLRIRQVFPFEFHTAFDWALVVHLLLLVGIIGSIIGIVVALVSLVKALSATR